MRHRPGSTTKVFHTTVAVSEETLRKIHNLAWYYSTSGKKVVEVLVRAASQGRSGIQELEKSL